MTRASACLDDATLVELAEGSLPDGEEEDARRHVAACDACRTKLEAQTGATADVDGDATQAEAPASEARRRERAAPDELAWGTRLGRYLVLDKLGRGGMGVVFAAYDPELHRRVALKLLRADPSGTESVSVGKARLLREAQAIARLSHPNVVQVYDVGTYEDHVFLALEFVDGETVGRWLKRERHGWREVLRVFQAAGRGLAAAHAAGLVHRDFKPDNVLIAKDGRVYVTDFGLARAAGDDDPMTGPTSGGRASRDSKPLFGPLTTVGTIRGTPGYAAPEYLGGTPVDARSDQFSFAAALYAGLYRRRPFPAASFGAYRAQLDQGLGEPPTGSSVPAWVRRAVERGLAVKPEARYPSMDAFLAALAADPAIRRRRWLAIGGVGAAVAVAITASAIAMRKDDRSALLCKGAERKLEGVWDPARREATRAAFLATDRSYKDIAFDRVAARLDERVAKWTAMHTEACEATQLRGEQPESMMALRMGCLDRRLRELRQLVDVFVAADAKVVEKAVAATSNLASLDTCADVARLGAAVEPPDAATKQGVDAVRTTLGRAKALADAGKIKEAAAVAKEAADAARALRYKPIEAEALVQLGEIQTVLGEAEASAATMRAAATSADAGRDDVSRARALAWNAGVVGYNLEKPADALAMAETASAVIERLGGDAYIESVLESSLGRIYSVSGDYERMYEHHHKSLALRQRLFGEDDPMTAAAHNNVGAALHSLGRPRDALVEHTKAFETRSKVLGPEHPDTAMSITNVGSQLYDLGDLEPALATTDKALVIARAALPAKHLTILIAQSNRGSLLAELERYDEAGAAFDEIITVLRVEQPKSLRLARAMANKAGVVLAPRGQGKAALALADAAVALATAAAGTLQHDDVALALGARGKALEALGKYDLARAALQQSIEIDEKVLGRDALGLLEALTALGRVELARGQPAEAVKPLERAIAICSKARVEGKWLAQARFVLARALVKTGARVRALELAGQAKEWFAASPLKHRAKEIDAWLAANR